MQEHLLCQLPHLYLTKYLHVLHLLSELRITFLLSGYYSDSKGYMLHIIIFTVSGPYLY